MALGAGTKLGPYEILSPLGAGGMSEVYRAKDTKLHREVTITGAVQEIDRDRLGHGTLAVGGHGGVIACVDAGRVGTEAVVVIFQDSGAARGAVGGRNPATP